MRVAVFTETYLPDANGVATHIKTLKDGLEALGHSVLIVKPDASSRRSYIEKDVVHCPAITAKRLYQYSLASPLSIKRLAMIKRWNPDIIHIQNEFGVGLSGVWIAKILKKPLVYTLHTMYDDYIYYVAKGPLAPMVTKLSHQYFGRIANRSNAVTGASKKVERYLIDSCKVRQPVHIIPNAVELDIFEESKLDKDKISSIRSEFNINHNTFTACFCGRLGKEKNLELLLHYWYESSRLPGSRKLIIYGDGPEKENLKKLAAELYIGNQVIFAGKIPHESLPEYYAACDCFITCSVSENYSISMLEALASGLPVVHLRDDENSSQLIEGVNGFVFDNEESFEKILSKLQALKPDEKKKLSDEVKKTVSGSGCKMLAEYLCELYLSL